MKKVCVLLSLIFCMTIGSAAWAETVDMSSSQLKQSVSDEFRGLSPKEWGETVSGVFRSLKTDEKVIALTLDACGSAKGKGYDAKLINFLIREQIPATLFINARWIDANMELFKQLAQNPLFEIANHGLLHRPASVSGRSVYGIAGTANIADLVDEIDGNTLKIYRLTGKQTRYYRSGTAYYDEIAVRVSERLGHAVIGFSLLGDAGATYSRKQVKSALLKARPGDIALLHMNHPEGGTADGVIDAIPELRRLGFRFVSLSDYKLGCLPAPTK